MSEKFKNLKIYNLQSKANLLAGMIMVREDTMPNISHNIMAIEQDISNSKKIPIISFLMNILRKRDLIILKTRKELYESELPQLKADLKKTQDELDQFRNSN